MLVLSRRIGERICIGDGIVVTVVASRGGRVRLGIEAPSQVAVDRQEISLRKHRDQRPEVAAPSAAVRPR